MIRSLFLLAALSLAGEARAHDIYTPLRSKNGTPCCGGTDCAAATYRERGGTFEFLTREKHWIAIPVDRIQFIPIPGDPPSDDSHRGHLCYRAAAEFDRADDPDRFSGEGQSIHIYCAFIEPGSI